MQWFVGIDRADRTHAIAVVDEAGRQHSSWEVAHSAEGLASLVARLEALTGDGGKVLVAMEDPHGLLVSTLLEAGYTVYAVNPKSVDRYRERWHPSGSKSDPEDALVLAQLLRTDREQHRPIHPSSELARELLCLTRHRRQLVALRTQLLNQLRATLKAYYPRALEVFCRLNQSLTLSFLETFPGPEELNSLTPRRWRAFLRKHRYTHPERADVLLARLREPQIRAPQWVIAGHQAFALALVNQLRELMTAIADLEKQIRARFQQHADHKLFASLPGAGPVVAPELLAEIGDARERYPTARSLKAEAGTAPVTRASGRRRHVYFRRACNTRLRKSLQQLARQSVLSSGWAEGYFASARERGHSSSRAARGLADQWARIIWRMWMDRTEYDEALHERNRIAHGTKAA